MGPEGINLTRTDEALETRAKVALHLRCAGLSLPDIARVMGLRSHTTARASCLRGAGMLMNDLDRSLRLMKMLFVTVGMAEKMPSKETDDE